MEVAKDELGIPELEFQQKKLRNKAKLKYLKHVRKPQKRSQSSSKLPKNLQPHTKDSHVPKNSPK